MTADACGEARNSLGAYVLGALDPADRARVAAHVGTCAACRDELASLAGLPGLLGRIKRADVEAMPAEPRSALLERILQAAAAERTHDRRRRVFASVAASVVLVAAIGVSIGVATTHHSARAVAVGAPLPGQTKTFTATNAADDVQATVTEWKKGWGAALDLTVTGVTAGLAGSSCQLVAVGRDGHTDIAASWAAPAAGYTGQTKVNASGATSLASSDITAFKVVGSNGATLVTIPAAWS